MTQGWVYTVVDVVIALRFLIIVDNFVTIKYKLRSGHWVVNGVKPLE